ncbi:Uncharacterized protein DAT39_013085, partial [Clarias magur]
THKSQAISGRIFILGTSRESLPILSRWCVLSYPRGVCKGASSTMRSLSLSLTLYCISLLCLQIYALPVAN